MRAGVLLLAAAALAGAAPAPAQSMPVPVEVQVPLLVKVLRYDRHLAERRGAERVFAVLFQDKVRESLEAKDAVVAALARLAPDALGKPLRVVALSHDPATLAADLEREQVDFLYVTPLRAVAVAEIATAAARHGVLTLSGVPDDVRQGLAVGIAEKRGRPAILLNLEAAEAAGASFSSELLKVAQVVGRETG